MSFTKIFPLSESRFLEFRAQFSNVFNTPQYVGNRHRHKFADVWPGDFRGADAFPASDREVQILMRIRLSKRVRRDGRGRRPPCCARLSSRCCVPALFRRTPANTRSAPRPNRTGERDRARQERQSGARPQARGLHCSRRQQAAAGDFFRSGKYRRCAAPPPRPKQPCFARLNPRATDVASALGYAAPERPAAHHPVFRSQLHATG